MKNNNFPDLSPVLCLWYPAIERREMKKTTLAYKRTCDREGHRPFSYLFAVLLNIGVLALDNDFDGLFAAELKAYAFA